MVQLIRPALIECAHNMQPKLAMYVNHPIESVHTIRGKNLGGVEV
jgi:hypothetical protein